MVTYKLFMINIFLLVKYVTGLFLIPVTNLSIYEQSLYADTHYVKIRFPHFANTVESHIFVIASFPYLLQNTKYPHLVKCELIFV